MDKTITFITGNVGKAEQLSKYLGINVSHYEDKTAKAEVCIGYFDGENLKVFNGEIEGIISDIPKGTNGFGWDEIFIPNGYNQTRSEMNELDYEATNPRKIALDKLSEYFDRS